MVRKIPYEYIESYKGFHCTIIGCYESAEGLGEIKKPKIIIDDESSDNYLTETAHSVGTLKSKWNTFKKKIDAEKV